MSVRLFACGDVVNFKGKKDFVDDKLKTLIKNSDISICNFEAPIKCSKMKPIKKAGPHIYQSRESIKYLKDVGFNFVSLANNHIYDYGQEALEETIQELKKFEIDFVGAGVDFKEAYQPKIIDKNGIKIGFLAGCVWMSL
jgi:poly-gamma-glutamate capsule biosynthesis protein CapA/YwtB (metallophosphatase superfamily)